MGMAASQARLLTLTSRLHDVEYKAQNIESQKIALATQQDELYQTYCDALDAKKIQVAFNTDNGGSSYKDATFANVCCYNENRKKQYTLKDAETGKVIVDSEVYNQYQIFDNDKYSFAWAMLGLGGNGAWADGDDDAAAVGFGRSQTTESGNLWMSEVEQTVYDKHVSAGDLDSGVKKAYDSLTETNDKYDASEATKSEVVDALNAFRDKLYSKYGTEIYKYMALNKGDSKEQNGNPDSQTADKDTEKAFDQKQFNYYVRLFEQIQSCGGCQEVDAAYTSGDEGKEWFNNMVTSGRVLIDVYNTNKDEWQETSVATSTNENYLQETSDDKDLDKAKATYEYELKKINTKDTKYDKELKNLETERTAITQEMDSIKKVKDDNIERTFGIFS